MPSVDHRHGSLSLVVMSCEWASPVTTRRDNLFDSPIVRRLSIVLRGFRILCLLRPARRTREQRNIHTTRTILCRNYPFLRPYVRCLLITDPFSFCFRWVNSSSLLFVCVCGDRYRERRLAGERFMSMFLLCIARGSLFIFSNYSNSLPWNF